MRPVLVVGFLVAFASIGVGFGGLGVSPDDVLAPGTPAPAVIVTTTEPDAVEVSDESSAEAVPKLERPSGAFVYGSSLVESDESGDEPVDELAVAAPTDTVEPTATAAPATATAEPTQPPAQPTATASVPPPPAPTTAPKPAATGRLSDAEVRIAAASAGWPAELLDQVVEVSWCESNHNPEASSGWAYGLMQVVPNWFDYAGVDFALWADPVSNLRVAYAAYQYDISRGSDPWSQWVCQPEVEAASVPPTATAAAPAALGGQ